MLELYHSLHLTPKVMLPKRPVFNLKSPRTTDLAEWRNLFAPILEVTKDSIDRKNIERILELIELANECGATHILAQIKHDQQYKSTSGVGDKWLEFEIVFGNIENESNFSHRLCEIV